MRWGGATETVFWCFLVLELLDSVQESLVFIGGIVLLIWKLIADPTETARDRNLPNRTHIDALQRNIRYSPSWSIRWDNQGHIEEEIDSQTSLAVGNARSVRAEAFLDRGSPTETFRVSGRGGVHGTDLSLEINTSVEEPRIATDPSDQSPSVSVVPATSSSSFKASPVASHCHLLPTERTPSKHSRQSSGYQLSRRKSDSRVPMLKSPLDFSVTEGRESYPLPVPGSDFYMGSNGGSNDGWSMRMFSELVASQRERWSFSSENTSYGHGKISRSNSQLMGSPSSTDMRTCGICSKLLTDKSSFSSQKIIANNELSVVAVLVCGHAYHADCLEYVTPETSKFDPSCPVCTTGGKPSKIFGKAPKIEVEPRYRNKISRIGIADVDLEDAAFSGQTKKGGKAGSKLSASSMKSSLGRPFLRRHFSIGGSKPSRSMSENESTSTKRKRFWTRSRKD
ncbi:hypothetical protein H6P81_009719 [Aristolochia fimbriata]|uniref:RING-type domain-containing protein n=1 Tax=Aristolochia fimbriata TaxID=158543 RepID=A0AAV7EMV6_ARIFI|nr:hypothetical protein H6P81_009719 [Aristolochia fimbriata]